MGWIKFFRPLSIVRRGRNSTLSDDEIKQHISKLAGDKGRWFAKDVEEYWASLDLQINKPTWLRILDRLVDDNVFRWLDFIAHKLPEIASTSDGFIEFIVKLRQKIGRDRADGMISNALINIGENDPKLGHALYERMISAGDGALAYTAGFILGGVGAKELNKVIEAAEHALASNNPFLRASIVRGLGIALRFQEKIDKRHRIFGIIRRLSWQAEEGITQIEMVRLYFALDRFDPQLSNDQLMKMAELGTSEIRSAIAHYLMPYRLSDPRAEVKIIELCSYEDKDYVLDELVYPLAQRGRQFTEESLAIIYRWIKENKYFKIRTIDWLLEEIGKGDLAKCIQIVESWISGESDEKFLFFMPIVLRELCKSNYPELLKFLKNWQKGDDKFLKITLKTMREVLTFAYEKRDYGPLVAKCFSLLKLVAQRKGVDYAMVIRGETDRIFQCFLVVEELEIQRPTFDYKAIQKNFGRYPRLKEFLGERWLKEMQRQNNKTHPLLYYLSRQELDYESLERQIQLLGEETEPSHRYLRRSFIRSILHHEAFLRHFNGLLKRISPLEKGARNLKSSLRNEKEFWQTVSEVEMIGTLRRRYREVKIEPEVNGKHLDLKVWLGHKEILFEVINPDRFKPLRFLTNAVLIPNRARDKIYDEFKKHIEPVKDKINLPVIIVLDVGRSEIDYRSVEGYLKGPTQYTIVLQEDTGEQIAAFSSRGQDSMSHLDPSMNLISAAICYKTLLGNDGRLHFEVWIIKNDDAERPLDRTDIDALIRAFK